MRRASILLLLCLPGLASPASADADLGALLRDLGSEDHDPRWRAYLELNRRMDPAVLPMLEGALPGYPELGQYYGVMHIQRHPPKLARGSLRRLTGASSLHLRVVAAAALYRIGEAGAAAIIVDALRAKGLDSDTRVTLLTRIYGISDERIQQAVREMVVPGADDALLGQALYLLYLVRDAAALPAARRLLGDERPSATALGGSFLLALGDASGVGALAAALRTGQVTSSAFYKVKLFLQQLKPAPVTVLDAVLASLEETLDVNVLRAAVEMLGEHGYAKAAPALRQLLDHRSSTVSKAAFQALAGLPGGVDPETMRKLLAEGSDERRLAAADALRRADDASGFETVLGILREGERYTDRAEAARVLGGFRRAEAVEPLLAALMDAQTTVRANAYNSLGYVLRALFPYRRLDLATTGYATSAAEGARREAVARIRAWWERSRSADW